MRPPPALALAALCLLALPAAAAAAYFDSSILAWETLWTEEPGRLQSTESQRVGND